MKNKSLIDNRPSWLKFLLFLLKIPFFILAIAASASSEEEKSGSRMKGLYKKDSSLFK